MNLGDRWAVALPCSDFLARYGSSADRSRWAQSLEQTTLTAPQKELLRSFTRQMKVLCLAGAWCGDCSAQCPIFERLAEAAPVIQIRYLDRDDQREVQAVLQINGGNRIPVLVFLSEDGFEVARYGERTLSKYRELMHALVGPGQLPGNQAPTCLLSELVVQDWLNEFERVQWMLRLSPRLRKLHGD